MSRSIYFPYQFIDPKLFYEKGIQDVNKILKKYTVKISVFKDVRYVLKFVEQTFSF